MEQLIITVRKLSQRYAYASIKLHETVAQKAGFSGTDHKYLGFFLQKGEMTAGRLAELSGLSTGAVTGLIDRLEARGLVKRRFDGKDRRKVMVVPDIEGINSILVPLYEDFQSASEKLIRSFSTEEIRTIEAYLQKALDLVEDSTVAVGQRADISGR